jgi:hypothetical protein
MNTFEQLIVSTPYATQKRGVIEDESVGVREITGEDLSSKAIERKPRITLSFDGKPSPDNPRTPTLVPRSGVLTKEDDNLVKKNKLPKKIKNTEPPTDVPIKDIGLFYADTPEEEEPLGDKRRQNGSINNRREDVLVFIANRRELPEEYAQDQRWVDLHTELHKVLSKYYNTITFEDKSLSVIPRSPSFTASLTPHSVNTTTSNITDLDVHFVKKAGRMYNYDFEFTCGSTVIKFEFKYCTSSPRIDALPQIYQGACSTTNIFDDVFVSFDEYYYDNGLSKYCEIDSLINESNPFPIIDKATYLKHVKSANSSHPFFVQLKSQYSKNVDEKNAIVNKTIEEYLKQCQSCVKLEEVSKLLQKQRDKTYLMWHPKTRQFYTEQIPEQELTITRVSHITKNTIVFVADKYSYCCLLRWKNGKGILNPAWQVSVKI